MSVNVLVTNHDDLPAMVKSLLVKREKARGLGNFADSDHLRDEIKKLGYLVNDLPTQTGNSGSLEVLKIGDESIKPAKNFLLLFGSGEIASSSVDIYRQTFLQLNKRHLKISLVTTPAGFQPNVDHVYGEIKDFFVSSLPDFNLVINIIPANNKDDANNLKIINDLDNSDIIFMGPGSPTYAVKHLRGTLLLEKIIDHVKKGSTLILSSAATLACSTHCLPVYEIFKVGEDLYWQEGLNLYKEIWQEISIIPHFNNTEGGADLDTSYCYLGRNRATKLLAMLPPSTSVLGIDEHTALVIDLKEGTNSIRGKGTTHKVL